MSPLDRKLLRDLVHLWGQMVAVALVVTCGIAMFVTLRSMHRYLLKTQASYYEQYRFAEVFAQVKRAPLAAAAEIAALPEIAAAEPRIVVDVLLDVPGLPEPATGRLVSIPRDRPRPWTPSISGAGAGSPAATRCWSAKRSRAPTACGSATPSGR